MESGIKRLERCCTVVQKLVVFITSYGDQLDGSDARKKRVSQSLLGLKFGSDSVQSSLLLQQSAVYSNTSDSEDIFDREKLRIVASLKEEILPLLEMNDVIMNIWNTFGATLLSIEDDSFRQAPGNVLLEKIYEDVAKVGLVLPTHPQITQEISLIRSTATAGKTSSYCLKRIESMMVTRMSIQDLAVRFTKLLRESFQMTQTDHLEKQLFSQRVTEVMDDAEKIKKAVKDFPQVASLFADEFGKLADAQEVSASLRALGEGWNA